MVDPNDKKAIVELLQGKTLSVYALLLTKGRMGVREVARELQLSSPSLALHHLTKLMDHGIIEKDAHGEYGVRRTVYVGTMTLFLKTGKYLFPRFVFLITLISMILTAYLVFFLSIPPDGKDILFLSVCTIVIIVLLFETRRIWSLKPF